MKNLDKDSVVNKVKQMKIDYIINEVYKSPDILSEYLAEFLGYTTILYSMYADFMVSFRKTESKVMGEEMSAMKELNSNAEKKGDKRTVDEKNSRIDYRMSKLKGERDMFEAEVKSATIQINGIQSLLKRMSDEAKGTV